MSLLGKGTGAPTNREGLTFAEWLNAANAFRARGRRLVAESRTRAAWQAGEDPSEWAVEERGK